VEGVRVSFHAFRHTFAKGWIPKGGDVFTLQRILGHTSMEMVLRYVNMTNTDLCRQHSRFNPGEDVSEQSGSAVSWGGDTGQVHQLAPLDDVTGRIGIQRWPQAFGWLSEKESGDSPKGVENRATRCHPNHHESAQYSRVHADAGVRRGPAYYP
jgi:hypothetical protein